MPSLSDTLRSSSPAGFAPMPAGPKLALPPPVSLPGQGNNFRPNPSIRCPMPPTSATPDTLRQFDQDGGVPKRRVLPLPISTIAGGGNVTNITNVSSTSGSSGGGSVVATLTAKMVLFTSPITLPPGGTVTQALNMSSKSFQLISCTANGPVEIRMYGSATAMAADAGRALDAPLPAELLNNLITDIALDTAPFVWYWQNRIGANSQTPQTTSAYISVTNLGAGMAQPQVSLTFLPLESL